MAAHRLAEEASLRHADKRIEKRTEKWAEEAFAQQYGGIPSCFENRPFHNGYVAGFKSHVLTGNSQLPVFPPEKYRKARFATPAGKYHIDTWFLGFQNGISAAVAGGYRELVVLRTPGSAGAQAPFPVGVGPRPLPPVLESPLGPPPMPSLSPAPPAPDDPFEPAEETSDPDATPHPDEGTEALRLPEIEQAAARTSEAKSAAVMPADAEVPAPASSAALRPQPDAAPARATVTLRPAPKAKVPPQGMPPTTSHRAPLPADLAEIIATLRPRPEPPEPAPREPRVEHVIIWETPPGQ